MDSMDIYPFFLAMETMENDDSHLHHHDFQTPISKTRIGNDDSQRIVPTLPQAGHV
jgi:hypothetical protein